MIYFSGEGGLKQLQKTCCNHQPNATKKKKNNNNRRDKQTEKMNISKETTEGAKRKEGTKELTRGYEIYREKNKMNVEAVFPGRPTIKVVFV